MESIIVIVAYKPRPGKADLLRNVLKSHHARLEALQLVTKRPPVLMESKEGCFIEVFEWVSKAAIEEAHSNPAVLKTWEEFNEAGEYIPVGQVAETSSLFSEFRPVT